MAISSYSYNTIWLQFFLFFHFNGFMVKIHQRSGDNLYHHPHINALIIQLAIYYYKIYTDVYVAMHISHD